MDDEWRVICEGEPAKREDCDVIKLGAGRVEEAEQPLRLYNTVMATSTATYVHIYLKVVIKLLLSGAREGEAFVQEVNMCVCMCGFSEKRSLKGCNILNFKSCYKFFIKYLCPHTRALTYTHSSICFRAFKTLAQVWGIRRTRPHFAVGHSSAEPNKERKCGFVAVVIFVLLVVVVMWLHTFVGSFSLPHYCCCSRLLLSYRKWWQPFCCMHTNYVTTPKATKQSARRMGCAAQAAKRSNIFTYILSLFMVLLLWCLVVCRSTMWQSGCCAIISGSPSKRTQSFKRGHAAAVRCVAYF